MYGQGLTPHFSGTRICEDKNDILVAVHQWTLHTKTKGHLTLSGRRQTMAELFVTSLLYQTTTRDHIWRMSERTIHCSKVVTKFLIKVNRDI